MSIIFQESTRTFRLNAKNTIYMFKILDDEGFMAHAYWGKKLSDTDASYIVRRIPSPSVMERERATILDTMPQEFPSEDVGDFREAAFGLLDSEGHEGCSLLYDSHAIYPGKPALRGLPATFGSEKDCETLELTLKDPVLGIKAILLYTVFEDLDVIARSVRIVNEGKAPVRLTRVLSASVDFDREDLDMVSLWGGWARENNAQRVPIQHGIQKVESARGESSNTYHPFMALMAHDATDDFGEVYGFNFVYSGNFIAETQKEQHGYIRALMGINPQHFGWKLVPGDSFQAPEVILVHSSEGLSGMTRTYHDLYRQHLVRGKYAHALRPVLINNWEATYFDFNTEKLLEIASLAAKQGIELFVMDDGWFGSRRSDNAGLGDWYVCEDVLPGGLKPLADGINALGMKFGLWIEPEMVNEDSDLYRAHPDWAIQIPGRKHSRKRNQLVLDFSRKEVVDYIYGMIHKVLSSANVEYVKWDMNRTLTNLGSYALDADRQQELSHRYVLGVYDMQNRLTTDFPQILLENCSSGGARFDPGMLYYSPQIWTSDNTDAIARLKIQAGTALMYPLSTIDANISIVPNHQTGRITPFTTRGDVAMCGTFGYQLDITKLTEEELSLIPKQVENYHRFNPLVTTGDYYRLHDIFTQDSWDSWMVVAKDRSEALVTYVQILAQGGDMIFPKVRLKGLEADSFYRIEGTDTVVSGQLLMQSGLQIDLKRGDYVSASVHLIREA